MMSTASKAQKRRAAKMFVSLTYIVEILFVLERVGLIKVTASHKDLHDWLCRRMIDINKDIETGKAAER